MSFFTKQSWKVRVLLHQTFFKLGKIIQFDMHIFILVNFLPEKIIFDFVLSYD